MTIVAAAMRKLLTLAYGVLKSGRAFDSLYGVDGGRKARKSGGEAEW
jgi:hypothetical protein